MWQEKLRDMFQKVFLSNDEHTQYLRGATKEFLHVFLENISLRQEPNDVVPRSHQATACLFDYDLNRATEGVDVQ